MAMSGAVRILVAKKAELMMKLAELEERITRLKADVEAVDRAILLFEPRYDLMSVKPRKRPKATKAFGRGMLQTSVLTALREAGRPMTSAEIEEAVRQSLKLQTGAKMNIRCVLLRQKALGVIEKIGNGRQAKWNINQAATVITGRLLPLPRP